MAPLVIHQALTAFSPLLGIFVTLKNYRNASGVFSTFSLLSMWCNVVSFFVYHTWNPISIRLNSISICGYDKNANNYQASLFLWKKLQEPSKLPQSLGVSTCRDRKDCPLITSNIGNSYTAVHYSLEMFYTYMNWPCQ